MIAPSAYPPLARLQAAWPILAEEALALLSHPPLPFDREGDRSHATIAASLPHAGWIASWGPQKHDWLTWGIATDDTYPFGDASCAETVKLLSSLKGIHVAGFSWFRPRMRLPIHDHPEMARLGLRTYHLGLRCPPHCLLLADDDYAYHTAGAVQIFDGSRPHCAWNGSDQDRIILYLEFSPTLLMDS